MENPELQKILESPELQSGDVKEHLKLAHSLIITENQQGALLVLSETVKKFGDNDKAHFELGNYLYEVGNYEQARKHLETAIELNPDKNSKKYFALAELVEPTQAIELYEKGIFLCMEKIKKIDQSKTDVIKINNELISQAYSGIAELSLLSNKNYVKILESIKLSLKYNEFYLEAYKQLILFYFNTQNEMECRQAIATFVLKLKQLESANSHSIAELDINLFKTIVRIMIEGEIFEDAVYVLEVGLSINKFDLETNYLYAFCLYNCKRDDEACEALEELKTMKILECGDEELITGYNELSAVLNKMIQEEDDEWEEEA